MTASSRHQRGGFSHQTANYNTGITWFSLPAYFQSTRVSTNYSVFNRDCGQAIVLLNQWNKNQNHSNIKTKRSYEHKMGKEDSHASIKHKRTLSISIARYKPYVWSHILDIIYIERDIYDRIYTLRIHLRRTLWTQKT